MEAASLWRSRMLPFLFNEGGRDEGRKMGGQREGRFICVQGHSYYLQETRQSLSIPRGE